MHFQLAADKNKKCVREVKNINPLLYDPFITMVIQLEYGLIMYKFMASSRITSMLG